jgi:hypothetical protein
LPKNNTENLKHTHNMHAHPRRKMGGEDKEIILK